MRIAISGLSLARTNSAARTVALVFLLLTSAACSKERAEPPIEKTGGPIIIISVDTLRADHLPIYGYSDVRTPNIDALARDGITFDNAYAHVPLTLPSHVSLLTGELPPQHGVRNNLGYRFDASAHETIPALLQKKGYATGAAVSSYVLRASTGLGAAFEHYDDTMDKSEGASVDQIQRAGSRTVAAAQSWIEANRKKPFFFLLHLYEPHHPYSPPEPFASEYKGREYDGEIAASDADVGRFIAFLRERGLYDAATIIFLSDHGEGLGDHGESQHGIFLYREAIRVPLVIKLPKASRGGSRVATPVQLADVLPTIAELTGMKLTPHTNATSLLTSKQPEKHRRIYIESMYPRIHLGLSDLASLVDATHQYIEAPRPELYELASDPQQKNNVIDAQRRIFAAMRRELSSYDRSLAAPSAVNPEEAAKLEALGYLSGGRSSSGPLGDPKEHIAELEAVASSSALINAGQIDEAIAALRRVVEENPRFTDGWSQLGSAYERAGRLEESIAAFRKAIEISPMLASDSAVSIADSYLSLGRIDDAIAHAKLALTTHPGAAHAVLAKAYLASRNLPAAESEAQALINDPSRKTEGLVALAQVRIAQRRIDEAAPLVQSARGAVQSGTSPAVPMLAFVEADLLARKGNIAAAERAFNEEIRSFPRNREAYVRLAVLQTLEGRTKDAEKTFTRMAKANPDASSYAIAADAFERLGKSDIAARWRAKTK